MWLKEAISDGEIDALSRAARAACNEDTIYPSWRGSNVNGRGECYNMACWLVSRLGGTIGRASGHYAWLSPDSAYYIDLTGHHSGRWTYARNSGTYHPTEVIANDRTQRFANRADRIFGSLDALIRVSLDYAGDAYPAAQPQAEDDSERFNDSWNDPENYWHDEPDASTPEGLYQFVYANGQLEVSPNHSHDELAGHAGVLDSSAHTGPFAAGHVVVTQGKATWEVQSNVNLHSFLRILKDASKQYGWQWGGMTDAEGQPITDTFGPAKSGKVLHFVFSNGHLLVGRTSVGDLVSRGSDDVGNEARSGSITIFGTRAVVSSVHVDALPSLFEFATDQGLTLYAGNDNVIKKIPDLQEDNNYDPQGDWNPAEPSQPDERLPTGLYRCPACSQLFPNWHVYQQHRREQESWGDPDRSNNGDRGFPAGLKDPVYGDGAHFTEQRQEPGITTGSISVLPARSWREAARVDGFMRYATAFNYDNDSHNFYVAYHHGDPVGYVAVTPDGGVTMAQSVFSRKGIATVLWGTLQKYYDQLYTGAAHEKSAAMLKKFGWFQTGPVIWKWAKGKAPTDMLDAPVPFIYDINDDKIFVGHPGARTSDIPGRFTPGGIVEGMYEPGGKVIIRSMTSVPYTIRHMLELWYYTHPQLEIKSVHLKDDAGRDTRLATTTKLKQLIAMNPAAHYATTRLMQHGGVVFVVGGAVRDLELGKEPADLDLMVTGIPGEDVGKLLRSLPGKTAHVGKSFGIFEYYCGGSHVQIALPRKERSTGDGHGDFEVQTDHRMKPEDDLFRRDFTANAMAVNLATGERLDPYGGLRDIERKRLRTLGPHSFQEDPLRVLRALSAVSRHGLDPDTETRTQMRESADAIKHLSAERIQHELDRIMEGKRPARAIRLAHETGVLAYLLPEVDACFGFDQNNPHHHKELGAHLLSVLGTISRRTTDKDLRLAALLHDIGKPGSAWLDPETDSNHFYAHHVRDQDGKRTGEVLGANHEELGAEMTEALMTRLRYPTNRILRVVALVSHHMYPGFTTMAGARRFLARVGTHDEDLFILRWADQDGKNLKHSSGEGAWDVSRNRQLVTRVRDEGQAFSVKDLAIDGRDLIEAGLKPGPQFGHILSSLMEKVMVDPSLNDRATLLDFALKP